MVPTFTTTFTIKEYYILPTEWFSVFVHLSEKNSHFFPYTALTDGIYDGHGVGLPKSLNTVYLTSRL
jgi:hypothetical protein